MTLSKIIFEYLQSNRRITVPALGTFLQKGDDEPILFSEFMKGDDGVLRELVTNSLSISEIEAAIYIDRFVFDLRHTAESGARFTMPYLGYISLDESGKFIFEYDHSITEVTLEEVVESIENNTQTTDEIEPTTNETTTEESAQESTAEVIKRLLEEEEEEESNQESEPQNYIEEEQVARKRVDLWLIVGIAAAVFAVIIIAYGFYVQWLLGNISFGETIDNLLYSTISATESAVQDAPAIIPTDSLTLPIE